MVTCVWETLIFGTRDWLLFGDLSFAACLPQLPGHRSGPQKVNALPERHRACHVRGEEGATAAEDSDGAEGVRTSDARVSDLSESPHAKWNPAGVPLPKPKGSPQNKLTKMSARGLVGVVGYGSPGCYVLLQVGNKDSCFDYLRSHHSLAAFQTFHHVPCFTRSGDTNVGSKGGNGA